MPKRLDQRGEVAQMDRWTNGQLDGGTAMCSSVLFPLQGR